jgi:hypothetical protein
LFAFLVAFIAAALLHWRVLYWGLFGLSFGLIAGGGEACIKHFILRVILYYSGSIPWNYTRFLDYATERIFLQRLVEATFLFTGCCWSILPNCDSARLNNAIALHNPQ